MIYKNLVQDKHQWGESVGAYLVNNTKNLYNMGENDICSIGDERNRETDCYPDF